MCLKKRVKGGNHVTIDSVAIFETGFFLLNLVILGGIVSLIVLGILALLKYLRK